MKNKIYINGLGSISAQPEEVPFSGKAIEYSKNIFPAITRDYKNFIPLIKLRRMSSAVKMGIGATKMALKEADIEIPDAIITATGQGSKQDTEKFLETILEQREEMITPTSFILSTHNTVGGQIALNLKCAAYNVTYTHSSASLEWALLDAILMFEEKNPGNILVGGVDEISPTISSFSYLNHQLKEEQIKNLELFKNTTPGSITSEGAHFFALSSEKKQNTYARLMDVEIFQAASQEGVEEQLITFLSRNNLNSQEINAVIFGKNGDCRYDHFYTFLQDRLFKDSQQIAYKHLSGDYNTVSGYALWLACKIFRSSAIPELLKLNSVIYKSSHYILLYNQDLGQNHSLILLSSCEI